MIFSLICGIIIYTFSVEVLFIYASFEVALSRDEVQAMAAAVRGGRHDGVSRAGSRFQL